MNKKIIGLTLAALGITASIATAQPAFIWNAGGGLDVKNLDSTTKPCQDFYQYVNGSWLSKNPIPADQTSWGSFNEVYEKNQNILHQLLDEATADVNASKGSNAQKVGDFYRSGMDTARIEAEGVKPLAGEFARIAALKKISEIDGLLAHFHSHGLNPLFRFFTGTDDKNSTQIIAQFSQGGLGLPDRDYYTKEDEKSKQLRTEYQKHVAKTFELLGDKPAQAEVNAKVVLDIETRLAKASMTRVERRDPNATYHKMKIDTLAALVPEFAWKKYLAAVGVPDGNEINVRQPLFLKEVGKMLSSVSVADWKTYFRWHLIHETSNELSSAFVNERFQFYGTTLTGAKEQRPRWKRVLQTTDGALGEALGQLYVAKAFTPEAKARMLTLVQNLKAALRERITGLEWMGEATKAQALRKLDAFTVKIGYPDKWRDYSALDISKQPYVLNAMAADVFAFKRMVGKIGKPIDRTEWGMTPPTVNAYYNPSLNEIVFPAGILQHPFFDPTADDAVNYGGIGSVIGHEMTHGFDDQGRQYDADGNLKNWWSPEDEKNFKARTEILEKQYSSYAPIDTLRINGKLTLGENIADLGGLKIAYLAFKKSLEGKPTPPKIDGFTAEQRFFLSFAQIWRDNVRPERLKLLLNTDPHSPDRFRVIGTLSNMPEFREAFGCSADKVETQVKIW